MHAGDSRIYHFHAGQLVQHTVDHSYVQGLVARGEITQAQALHHPKANVLVGCLGSEADPPVSLHTLACVQPGDVMLACSDGLWHYFTPQEMAAVVDALTPREATEFLIGKARLRAQGSGDNLSLVVVKIEALAA